MTSSEQPSAAPAKFVDDLMQNFASQTTLPSFKQAKSIVKAAIGGMANGEVKEKLLSDLPAILDQLKERLTIQSIDVAGEPKAVHKKRKKSEDVGPETYIHQALHLTGAAAARLLCERTPPHPVLLASALPQQDNPTKADVEHATHVCACLLASSTSPAAHLSLAPALDVIQGCVSSSLPHCLTLHPAPCSTPEQVDAHQRNALHACQASLDKLASLCILQRSSASSAPVLTALPGHCLADAATALEDIMPRLLHTRALCAFAHMLAQHQAATQLRTAAIRTMIQCISASVEPLASALDCTLPDSASFLAAHAVLQADASTLSPLQYAEAVAWAAVHAALTGGSAAAPEVHGPLTLEAVLAQRQCAALHVLLGDRGTAARLLDALDDRPCEEPLLEWLQLQPLTALVDGCQRAAARGAQHLCHHLVRSVSLGELHKLHTAFREGRLVEGAGGAASGGAAGAPVDDEDIFFVDTGTAFDAGWERGAEDGEDDAEESGSDGGLDVDQLPGGAAFAADSSDSGAGEESDSKGIESAEQWPQRSIRTRSSRKTGPSVGAPSSHEDSRNGDGRNS